MQLRRYDPLPHFRFLEGSPFVEPLGTGAMVDLLGGSVSHFAG